MRRVQRDRTPTSIFRKNVPCSAVDRLDPHEETVGDRDDVCFVNLYNTFVVDLHTEDIVQELTDHAWLWTTSAYAVDQTLQRRVVAYIHGERLPDACVDAQNTPHVTEAHVFGGEHDGSRGFDVHKRHVCFAFLRICVYDPHRFFAARCAARKKFITHHGAWCAFKNRVFMTTRTGLA